MRNLNKILHKLEVDKVLETIINVTKKENENVQKRQQHF